MAGEAGAGKTFLVKAVVERVAKHSLVLVGACDPLATPPLSPLLDIAADPNSDLAGVVGRPDQHEAFTAFLSRLRLALIA